LIFVSLAVAACAQGNRARDDAGTDPGPDARAAADASTGFPDARPVAPDATPVDMTPDASPPPPPPPDAGSQCTPVIVNLLANPTFDQGPGLGWQETSSFSPPFPLVTHQDELQGALAANTPPWLVWMGGYLQTTTVSGVDTLQQQITLPAGATGFELIGFRMVATEEDIGLGEFDTARITIRNTANVVLEPLRDPTAPCTLNGCTWSNENATAEFSAFTMIPVGSYAGQTIRIHVESDVDDILNTNFFLDSFAARVTVCQ
jgi:hypothetical protein